MIVDVFHDPLLNPCLTALSLSLRFLSALHFPPPPACGMRFLVKVVEILATFLVQTKCQPFYKSLILFFIFACFCGLTSVAQVALQLGMIILPQSPEYWDYKYRPPRILDIFVLRSQLLYTIVHMLPL